MSAAPKLDGSSSQAPLRPLSDREFTELRDLIHREAGIFLSEAKKALVVGRLSRRLRALGLESFGGYRELVERDPEERAQMLDCICTNETHFFREPQHFDLIRDQLAAEWEQAAREGRRPRVVRVWSAACSTGEEPYTLAMVLLGRLPPEAGWQIEILATDLSRQALMKAEACVWPIQKAAEIPASDLKRFMMRGTGAQEGLMKAGPDIRSVVRFGRVNLLAEPFPSLGRFDLVFCRNALIYFSPSARAVAMGRLLDSLEPTGTLFLGHAETLSGMDRVRCVMPTVYRFRDPQGAAENRGAAPDWAAGAPRLLPTTSPLASAPRRKATGSFRILGDPRACSEAPQGSGCAEDGEPSREER